ncbi:hypothetical protein E3U43_002574 [Larimichthys crocea]|uniref:Uncharacterized protein n=1 Tax=Larimichthys crocea TaxID=215358 RepID=A0ACD3QRW7_LARCR|nr:hypothetical protein E3U43_002574 [Larimichthys crocea]
MAVAEAVMPAITPFPSVQTMEGKQFDNLCKVDDCARGSARAGADNPLIEVEFSIMQSPALAQREDDELGKFLDLEFILSNTIGSDVVSNNSSGNISPPQQQCAYSLPESPESCSGASVPDCSDHPSFSPSRTELPRHRELHRCGASAQSHGGASHTRDELPRGELTGQRRQGERRAGVHRTASDEFGHHSSSSRSSPGGHVASTAWIQN